MAKTRKTLWNPVIEWIDYRLPVFSYTQHHLIDYPTPKNLNYLWNTGSAAGIMLLIMIVTGIFLAVNYTAETSMAFDAVEHIMRDVNYGWLLRYLHSNGSSIFFMLVYIHMFRGMYYGSYKQPRELLWIIGVVIYLSMMMTAFMGYVLPWGQMSYWAAIVITSLFSTVPLIGETLVTWIWGGYTLSNASIARFFVGHYLMPAVIFNLVVVHMWALHVHKSNNPLGIDIKGKQDSIPFHPYYTIKDIFGFSVVMVVYLFFVFFAPDAFSEPINYEHANPMVTPPHIVPEW
ncbi:MAG: cytochrome b N-terminal domain-containing protein, partial [Rhodospirillales bacterium]